MTQSLFIIPRLQQEFTPLQKEFNKLILQLEQVDQKLEKSRKLLDGKLHFTVTYLYPYQAKLSAMDAEMIRCLYGYYKSWKLSVSRRNLLADFIMNHISNTLAGYSGLDQKESDELSTIYDTLYKEVYGVKPSRKEDEEDEMEEWFKGSMEDLQDQLKMEGFDVDLSGLSSTMTEEEVDVYMKEMQKKFEAAQDQGKKSGRRRKNPDKKSLRDRRQEEREELKNQNISSIFKKIAKVIHPDLEPDPDKRIKKEELMKQLTAAYEKKDLRTMLRLEMEWVMGENDKLDQLADDKLTIFIELLKEQLKDLKNSISEICYQPKYNPMYAFAPPFASLNLWKPERKLNEMQQNYSKNSVTLEIIKKENRLSRDTINSWLDLHRENVGNEIEF